MCCRDKKAIVMIGNIYIYTVYIYETTWQMMTTRIIIYNLRLEDNTFQVFLQCSMQYVMFGSIDFCLETNLIGLR